MFVLASKDNYFTKKLFTQLTSYYDSNTFYLVTTKEALNDILKLNPEKIFFFHWSYIVSENICNGYTCINIHTSNLPYGKGGSPLQNQIVDGVLESKVNALRMIKEVDGGPIYCSRPITLHGSVFDIWNSITKLSFSIITDIIDNNIQPVEQPKLEDETIYKRIKDNKLPFDACSLEELYDHIRMVDSKYYPDPYIEIGNFRLQFNRGQYDGETVLCDVKISKKD